MSDLHGGDPGDPGHLSPLHHAHDDWGLHDLLGAHGLGDIADPLAHGGLGDDPFHHGSPWADPAYAHDTGAHDDPADPLDPSTLVQGLVPVDSPAGDPLLVDPALLGPSNPADAPPVAFDPGGTAFDLGPDPLAGLHVSAWGGAAAFVLPDVAHDPGDYASTWNADAGGGGILALVGALDVEVDFDDDEVGEWAAGGVVDLVAGPGGLGVIAAEMWAESMPDTPLPTDDEGAPLPAEDILAQLVASADDPVAVDVASSLLGDR